MWHLGRTRRKTTIIPQRDPKGKWFVERMYPKGIDYKKYVHSGSIRHAFRRIAIEGGITHRVVIGCPKVDPETGRPTKWDSRRRLCSTSPVMLNIWHPLTRAEVTKVRRARKRMGKKPPATARERAQVRTRERNMERWERLVSYMRGRTARRAVAGMGAARRSRGAGIPAGLVVTLIGVGVVTVAGLAGFFRLTP